MFYRVAISKISVDETFVYSSDVKLEIGERVIVDFHGRKVKGYVVEESEAPGRKIKPILERLDGFSFLSENDVLLAKWISEQYLVPIGKVFDLLLPSYIDKYLETFVEPTTELIGLKRTKLQDFLKTRSEEDLKMLLKKGYVRLSKSKEAIKMPRIPAEKTFVILTDDLSKLLHKVENEIEYDVLNYLSLAKVSKTEDLINALGISMKELEKMVLKGIIRFSSLALPVESIASREGSLRFHLENNAILIFGQDDIARFKFVIPKISEVLSQGKSILFLSPYVSQAVKLAGIANVVFEQRSIVFHANLTDARKTFAWLSAYTGKPAIFFATRAGVFLPIKNLGLIVIESEEEESYYQMHEPIYDAVEIAWKKAEFFKVPLIALSASGRLKTFVRVEKNSRYDISVKNTNVIIEKLREKQIVSPKMLEEIDRKLREGYGALIITRRKGYAPYVICFVCETLVKCPNCDVPLSYHKLKHTLKCHLCGWEEQAVRNCPKCGAPALYPIGFGGERLERVLKYHIPEAVIRFLDVEEYDEKSLLESLIKFEVGQTDVLIVTQPIAHLVSLSRVGFVGITNIDSFLNQPDYSSTERMIQFVRKITQLGAKVTVLIQVRNIDPGIITSYINEPLENLYESELLRRKESKYPPYCDIVQVILESHDAAIGWEIIQDFAAKLQMAEILGPVEHPMFKVGGKYRYHFIAKTQQLKLTLEEIRRQYKLVGKHGIKVLVNPPRLV
ncbi:replication restart helicase PriA [Pseudothermotoga thermarum]|uniref:Probable replication restart protein PriA n=1 Tax=Pseudothermotoga thermarum DSM 5069 TaxID=688269 RepID=F7YY98_9THEM|nr:primosomal protein N' [Pseudothermotoga thermarum]AEH50919.1 primosomal protein N' [Pseudothermotoga thermarum DSM 5069]